MKRTICSICSAGCGVVAEVDESSNTWLRQDMAIDHPIVKEATVQKELTKLI